MRSEASTTRTEEQVYEQRRFEETDGDLWISEFLVGYQAKNPHASVEEMTSYLLSESLKMSTISSNSQHQRKDILEEPRTILMQNERGEQKGLKIILSAERGYNIAGMKHVDLVASSWGNVKCNVRKQCDYAFSNLERTVPQCLDVVSKRMLRKFARSYRYIDAYRHEDINGHLTPEVVEWNVKQYSSHRRIDKLLKIEEKLERADDDESSDEEEASEEQEHMDDP